MATEIDDALYIKLPNGETKRLGITSVATQTSKGLMSAEDKKKLDGLSPTQGMDGLSINENGELCCNIEE